jgi:GalNAc5-diNAcBac-PP-undecaprenol beta-1,3-glucosyltransferase
VASALAQSVEDLEVLIVGDGVPDGARTVIDDLVHSDERVRFFDNPKGPRLGEVHRVRALAEARGAIVCYLCDDDLWMPDHVETLLGLLEDADFAHTMVLSVDGTGRPTTFLLDLADPDDRLLILGDENRIPLSASGHTLDAYRRLPYGWRTTPAGVPTDQYMFQQFLAEPWVRAVSGRRPTVVHLPSAHREGWTLEQRVAELEQWISRVSDAAWCRDELAWLAFESALNGWSGSDRWVRRMRKSALWQAGTRWARRARRVQERLRGPR